MTDTVLGVNVFYPNFFADRQIAYVCLSIVEGLSEEGRLRAAVMGMSSDSTVDRFMGRCPVGRQGGIEQARAIYTDAIPRGIPWAVATRLLSARQRLAIAEARFGAGLAMGDVAYLWPGASPALYRNARSRGCLVVSERINTLRRSSRAILDREFEALGIPPAHGISEESAEEELTCMRLSDFIFSPSPAVTESLLDSGITPHAILPTSYGLRKSDILEAPPRGVTDDPVVAIFVGRVCVRKGVHLLLRAWSRARVRGRLRIVGSVAPEMATMLREHLERDGTIEHVDYVEDLRPIYESADFLVLPSVEEGSPLVTYLALGSSLPVVASPMGAGGVIMDSREGIVVDPHDEEGLADAIRRLAETPELRRAMSERAAAAAPYFTWERVAGRRREQLLQCAASRQAQQDLKAGERK